ncbi:tryptophan halogenase family protein [Streptomyces sp. NRRL WC-3742]|uniref:tryptophan halogenase family protein n=1 Tax=Streptomyces sp. NRRL WC-3742 TaxID=1463934 RepID=UPI0004C54084|nr:tryptophan halogenase family protein [Streptomyces sp. NRRL WC-3742]
MDARITSVVVLGGGPAGWMSAAYLRKALQGTVEVTVLEEPETAADAGIEAALPTLQRSFFAALGISEDAWMRESGATFGTALRFVNWRTGGAGETRPRELPQGGPDASYHAFGLLPEYEQVPLSHYWHHRRHHGGTVEPFDYACFREPPLLDARRSPRWMDGRPATRYGWHLDRARFTDFLRRHATGRLGVRRVPGTLARVELDANGYIEALHTTAGEALDGDLFIDCSGPRARLLRQVMAEPYLDLGDQLLCDRAVTVRLPHDDFAHGLEPYRTAVAMPAGWAGKTPLLGEFESSYVYASAFADAGTATEDLCRLWGLDPEKAEVAETAFRAGRTRSAWVRNCVGIGSSAGLLEPLEPTALHFVTSALQQLVRHFPADAFTPALLDGFNREVATEFDESRDFVQAHFACTRRTDTPFWRAHGRIALPESLRAKTLAYFAGLPLGAPATEERAYYGGATPEPGRIWSNASYYAVLAGLGVEPDAPLPALAHRPESVRGAEPLFERIKRQQRNLVDTLPDAHDYLRHLHGRSVADRSGVRPGS